MKRGGTSISQKTTSFWSHPQYGVAYFLAFLMLAEWLVPLPEITQTGYVFFFLVLTGSFFIINTLPVPFILRFLLIVFIILYGVHAVFMTETFLSAAWWPVFGQEIWQQTALIFTGNWLELSDFYRSFLFLLLLAIMSYLLYYWVVYVKRILFFFVGSILYIGILDTFTTYDGQWPIVRLFIIGFMLFAVLRMSRFSFDYTNVRAMQWVRWLGSSLAVVALAAFVGFAAPKYVPQWPDPLPYLEGSATIGEGGWGQEDYRRIGYGQNDERLGGDFLQDETTVFTARTGSRGYWRGEAKHTYTGHGWEDTEQEEEETSRVELYDDELAVEEMSAEVMMNDTVADPLIFSQGALTTIDHEEQNLDLEVDRETGRSYAVDDGEAVRLDEFSLTFDDAQFPIDWMQKIDGSESETHDPEEITDQYLQLPDNLPERVENLAENLVADEENRYDRVRAVEMYLNSPDFTYETVDVPIPEENQDYVDQFLFETMRGYCDNFSTAMVVLLRTQDIPARWTKGFTTGEETHISVDESEYEVTNANAHSWVEVYFPDVGWVPFEPTPGFANAADYVFGDIDGGGESDEEVEEEDEDLEEESEEELESEEDLAAANDEGAAQPPYLLLSGIGAGLTLVGLAAFLLRGRFVQTVLLKRYEKIEDDRTYIRAYESLLWYIEWRGMKKKPSETLKEFAARVDQRYKNNDMQTLTALYERFYYGGKSTDSFPEGIQLRWQRMIECISNRK